ncbi:hypothetical protein O6H91_08G112900 [Diphasiastrum complanatum]|uniref:Uncharacterized protein n=1 Tax=Diphasiastrum complanatum TaxID=34168 RepID=A0ACC2D157_DIPCM|nr:hypothetical protein O6H91_08G112900 [Diphasiastrum complanatum]
MFLVLRLHHLPKVVHRSCPELQKTAEKYRRYTMEYVQRLNHKYFSDQNLTLVGPLFERSTKVDEFEIKESKDSPLEKLQNIPCYTEDHIDPGTSVAEANPIFTAKKKQPKKYQEL